MSPSSPASASARNCRPILPVCFSAEVVRPAPAAALTAFAPEDFEREVLDIARKDFHILVAAAGKIQDHNFVLPHFRCPANKFRQSVRGFKRGNNSFDARERAGRRNGVFIVDGRVFSATLLRKPSVLGTDAGIIE